MNSVQPVSTMLYPSYPTANLWEAPPRLICVRSTQSVSLGQGYISLQIGEAGIRSKKGKERLAVESRFIVV